MYYYVTICVSVYECIFVFNLFQIAYSCGYLCSIIFNLNLNIRIFIYTYLTWPSSTVHLFVYLLYVHRPVCSWWANFITIVIMIIAFEKSTSMKRVRSMCPKSRDVCSAPVPEMFAQLSPILGKDKWCMDCSRPPANEHEVLHRKDTPNGFVQMNSAWRWFV